MKAKINFFLFIFLYSSDAYAYIDPSSIGAFLSAIVAYILLFITTLAAYTLKFYQILKYYFQKIDNSVFFKKIFLFSVANALMLNYWFLIGLPKKYFPNSNIIENWNNGLIGIIYVLLIFSLILLLEKFLKKKNLQEIYFIFLIIISFNSIRVLFSTSYLYIIALTFILFLDYFYIKFKLNLRIVLMIFLTPLSLFFFFILNESIFLFKNYKPYNYYDIMKDDQKKLFVILLDDLDYRLAFDGNLKNNSEFLDLYKSSKIYLNLTSVKSQNQDKVGTNSIIKILSPKFSLEETDSFIKNFRKDNFKIYNDENHIFSYLKEKNKLVSLYGHFHPYCTIFKSYLSKCNYSFEGFYSNLDIIISNFVNQYKKIFDKFNFVKFKKQFSNIHDEREFNEYYSTLQNNNFEKNLEVIQNLQMGYDVYFLHLNFPSDHYIYREDIKKFLPQKCKTNKEKCSLKDFQGNMNLANQLIRELRDILQEDKYTLILFSEAGNRRINNDIREAFNNNVLLIFDSENLKQELIYDKIPIDKALFAEIKNKFN